MDMNRNFTIESPAKRGAVGERDAIRFALDAELLAQAEADAHVGSDTLSLGEHRAAETQRHNENDRARSSWHVQSSCHC